MAQIEVVMDLKIEDVAELLNVSEATVKKWLVDGKIPSYRMNQQYRFDRVEIEDWVLSQGNSNENSGLSFNRLSSKSDPHKQADGKLSAGGSRQFSLYRAIHKGGLFYSIPGEDKESVIKAATKQISKSLSIDSDVVSNLLLERESLQSTAVNNGIAIPHTRDFFLDGHVDAVAVVFPNKPIEYGALDGKPVNTLFFLFAGNDKRHLHLLAKIAHLSSQKETLTFLRTKPSKNEILEYIKDWESQIQQPKDSFSDENF